LGDVVEAIEDVGFHAALAQNALADHAGGFLLTLAASYSEMLSRRTLAFMQHWHRTHWLILQVCLVESSGCGVGYGLTGVGLRGCEAIEEVGFDAALAQDALADLAGISC
jgi:hypothetical protein